MMPHTASSQSDSHADSLAEKVQRWGFFVPINAVAGWKQVSDVVSYVEMRLAQRGGRA